jgi:hypothetical protein
MATPLTAVKFNARALTGADAGGGKVYTYAAGTTTPQATYTTAAGTVANANPVILDSAGRAAIYLDPALSYKFVITDANDVALPDGTVDNWSALSSGDVSFLQSGTGAVRRTVQAELRDQPMTSLANFASAGTIGVGNAAADTAALNAAIAYANDNYSVSNYKRQILLPPGNYLFERIELDSLRGLTFVGAGTMDANRRKTRWAYAGPGGEDAALLIRSCAFVQFRGIIFDINSAEGMGNLIRFTANDTATVAPRNRFSSNWITFEDCAFVIQDAITTKPDATVWAKSCFSTFFKNCEFFPAANGVALKLGADTDVDPDNGNPTVANGLCITTTLDTCFFLGDIEREKNYHMRIVDTQFVVRQDDPTVVAKLTVSGNALTINEHIDNCTWDLTEVSSFTGILIQGGTDSSSSGLRITGTQLAGKVTLVRVAQGDAWIVGNRPLAHGSLSNQRFVSIASTAKNVVVQANREEGYIAVNDPGSSPIARMVYDERTSKFWPVIAVGEKDVAVTLPGAGAYQSILSQTHKFGGGYVRVSYSICIQHKDGGTARVYTTRVLVDGTLVEGTVRRASATGLDDFITLAMTHIVYIAPTDDDVTIEVEAQQGSGAVLGIVQGADTVGRSSWAVELLTF